MKRFLVIDWGLMGDVLCTTPIFSIIKKNHPNANITVITKPYAYEILKNNPYIDKILILNKKSHAKDMSSSSGWLNLVGVLFNNYDYCIDLYGSPRSAMITFLSRAKEKITVHNSGRLLERLAYDTVILGEDSYGLQGYIPPLCDNFKFKYETLQPEFYFSDEDISDAEKRLVSKSKKQVGIFVGASWEAKRWPLSNVKGLTEALKNKGIQFYIIFGPLESEGFKRECLGLFKDIPIINNVSLTVLGAMIKSFDLLISNDSGPVHIAKAVGTTCIGLFGPNHPNGVNFQEPNVSLSGYYNCSFNRGKTKSCNNRKCKTHECMNSISVEEVKEKVLKTLFVLQR